MRVLSIFIPKLCVCECYKSALPLCVLGLNKSVCACHFCRCMLKVLQKCSSFVCSRPEQECLCLSFLSLHAESVTKVLFLLCVLGLNKSVCACHFCRCMLKVLQKCSSFVCSRPEQECLCLSFLSLHAESVTKVLFLCVF